MAQTFGKHTLLVCFQVKLLFILMISDDLQNDISSVILMVPRLGCEGLIVRHVWQHMFTD